MDKWGKYIMKLKFLAPFFIILFAYSFDNLEYKLKYGDKYYLKQIQVLDQKNKELENEIKELKNIIRIHNKVIKIILNEEKNSPKNSDKLVIIEVKKRIAVYKTKNRNSKPIFYLHKGYLFKATKEGKWVKMRFYFNDKKKWHYVKRDRYLLFDKKKLIIIK